MEVTKIKNIDFDELKSIEFDLAIYACGYEIRSSFLFQQNIRSTETVYLKFMNHQEEKSFRKNTIIYGSTLCIEQRHDKNEKLIDYLKTFLKNNKKENLKILIDYSSMSRLWYSAILFYFKYLKAENSISLYFNYSIPKKPKTIGNYKGIHFSPIEYFSRISIPEKPTALIVCLGDNSFQSIGLKNFFDAEKVILFYAESKYQEEILQLNNSILEKTSDRNLYGFPLRDTLYTKFILEKICKETLSDYRIVIAPCGPKTFTLASFIVAMSIEEIDIWRVSKSTEVVELKEPNGEVIITSIEMKTVTNNMYHSIG